MRPLQLSPTYCATHKRVNAYAGWVPIILRNYVAAGICWITREYGPRPEGSLRVQPAPQHSPGTGLHPGCTADHMAAAVSGLVHDGPFTHAYNGGTGGQSSPQ